MESVITIAAAGLGVASAALMLFCCAGYLLRKGAKRFGSGAGKRVRRVLRFAKKHHRAAGIGATVLMGAHFLVNAAVVHQMSSVGVLLGAGLALLTRNGLSRERKNWLHVHRTLAAGVMALLVVHVFSQVVGVI